MEVVKNEVLNLILKKSSTNSSSNSWTVDGYQSSTKFKNYVTNEGNFPAEFKRLEVTMPPFKKGDPIQRKNNKSVSLLSHTSKVFKRMTHKQLDLLMQNKLSKFTTGFRRSHGKKQDIDLEFKFQVDAKFTLTCWTDNFAFSSSQHLLLCDISNFL